MALRNGETFADFRILGLLASGSEGELYSVDHPRLTRPAALKILPSELSADPQYRDRFKREAGLSAALRCPTIATMYFDGFYDGQLWMLFEDATGLDMGVPEAAPTVVASYPPTAPLGTAPTVASGHPNPRDSDMDATSVRPRASSADQDGPSSPAPETIVGDTTGPLLPASRHRASHAAPATKGRDPLRALLVGALVVVLVVAGYLVANATGLLSSDATPTATAAPPTEPPPTSEAPPVPAAPPTPAATDAGALEADFATLRSSTAGEIGIVLLPIGGGSQITLGDWTDGAAWSTSKVPLSIAALRKDPSVMGSVDSAIQNSDNGAADALWKSLGDPETAAAAVGEVLKQSGDSTTVVQSQKVRPEFSAFGQTVWPLSRQASFMAWAACDRSDPNVATVLGLMGQIAGDQQWGLGGITNTRFKGGWGPSNAGYLVRQLGVIDQGGELTAVAIASDSGSFGSGTSDLSLIATWLNQHLAQLPKGQCAA